MKMQPEDNLILKSDMAKVSDTRKEEIRLSIQKEGRLNNFGGVDLTKEEIQYLQESSGWCHDAFAERAKQWGNLTLNQYVYLYEERQTAFKSAKSSSPFFEQIYANAQKRLTTLIDLCFNGNLRRSFFFDREVVLLKVVPKEWQGKKYAHIECADLEMEVLYSANVYEKHLPQSLPLEKLNSYVDKHLHLRAWGEDMLLHNNTPAGIFGTNYGRSVHIEYYDRISMRLASKNAGLLPSDEYATQGFKPISFRAVMQKALEDMPSLIEKVHNDIAFWEKQKQEYPPRDPFDYDYRPNKEIEHSKQYEEQLNERTLRIEQYLAEHPELM